MLHSDASCSNGRYASPALRQGATGTPTLHPPLYPPSSPPLPQNEGGAFQGTQSTQGGNVGGTVRTATNPSSSKAKARLAPLGKAHSWVQRVVLPLGCLSSTVEPPDGAAEPAMVPTSSWSRPWATAKTSEAARETKQDQERANRREKKAACEWIAQQEGKITSGTELSHSLRQRQSGGA
jgi:hypothetical protein